MVPKQIQQSRLEICHKCEHYQSRFGQCGVCHCFMVLKTRLNGAECPKKKWLKYAKRST